MRVKMCWPDPTGMCLRGGCYYCTEIGKYVWTWRLRRYAKKNNLLFSFELGEKQLWPRNLKKRWW